MEENGEKVFPVYHVLYAVGELSGSKARLFSSSDPSKLIGMLLCRGRRSRAIVINLTNSTQKVSVRGLAQDLHVRMLDRLKLKSVLDGPEIFKGPAEHIHLGQGNILNRTLQPYAIMIVDAEHR